MTKIMDHTAYQRRLRRLPDESLRYIMADAHETLQLQPDSPNAGYYQDEINYCGMELARRSKEA